VKSPRRKGATAKGPGRARREKSAGGVVVRFNGAEPLFLLIRDSYGHWGFPKGHLERGEPADAAARREVLEETGLAAVELLGAIASIDWRFRFRGNLIHKQCEFFLMKTLSEATRPQKSEGITACKWSTHAEAQKLLAYENARGVLQRAHEMLMEQPSTRMQA
jgi:8-oxo-dGTP pyrophosphatase MutT (NUDIX family)